MTGMGMSAIQATPGAAMKNMALMTSTVVVTWIRSLAPTSRKR